MPVLTNIRHELFAQAVAKGVVYTEAYEQAGYRRNEGNPSRLRLNKKVSARISELVREAALSTGVTAEAIARELAAIGFFDLGDVAEWGMEPAKRVVPYPGRKPKPRLNLAYVKLRNSKDLPPHIRRCVAQVRRTKDGVHIIPYDKLAALGRLGSHLGMWKEKPEDDQDGKKLVDMIVEAYNRSRGDEAQVIEGEQADESVRGA